MNGALAGDLLASQSNRRKPSYDDNGSRSILPRHFLRDAQAREAPKLKAGAVARNFLAIQSSWWRPNYDDQGSRSILPHDMLRDALDREAPKLKSGALARDFIAIHSSWCVARGLVSLAAMAARCAYSVQC